MLLQSNIDEIRKNKNRRKLRKVLNAIFFYVSLLNFKNLKDVNRKRKKSTLQSSKTLLNILLNQENKENRFTGRKASSLVLYYNHLFFIYNIYKILMPNDKFKIIWNFVLVVILLMTGLFTPFRVCFVDDSDDANWFDLDLFFDVSFGLDILINFISAYYDKHNRLRKTFKEIAINYLSGWFWIDIVAL